MKRIISTVIVITMILSMFTGVVSSAAILQESDVTAIFTDNFDDFSKFDKGINPHKDLSSETEGQTDFFGCGIKEYNGNNVLWVKDNNEDNRVTVVSQAFAVKPNTIYTIMADSYAEKGIFNIASNLYTSLEYPDSSHGVTSTDYPENYEYGRSIYADFEKVKETLVCHVMTSENTKAMRTYISSSLLTPTEGYLDNLRVYEGYVEYQRPSDIDAPVQATPVSGELIKPVGEKLTYNTYNDEGDTLTDFSYAGYYKGEYEIPDSSKLTLYAEVPHIESDDHTAYIQGYIDGAGNTYANTGRLQVVKIKAGRYNINKGGVYLRSGVILSGEGQGPDGTVFYNKDVRIYGKESEPSTIIIAGTKPQMVGETANITDKYVKAGSKEFKIEKDKISSFKIGDLITIMHPNTDKWNKAMGMTNITSSSGTNSSWDEGEVMMATERTVVAIDEDTITVDYPLYVPYDNTVAQSYIYVTNDSGRLHDIGIENLRCESYYNGIPTDENHAQNAISITNAKNCYVRDISGKYFVGSTVSISNGSKQITVKNCSSLKPVSTESGSRRYAFAISNAQQILVTGCYSYDGRHDYVVSNPATGPIVFSDSVSDLSNSNTEPHGIWSTGILYDNIFSVSNYAATSINVANGGYSGITVTHGWLGGGVVMYNCLAAAITAIKPPLTYQNFMIGAWGFYDDEAAAMRKIRSAKGLITAYHTTDLTEGPASIAATVDGTSFVGDAYKESQFAPVEPRSLYKAQLAERLTGSFKNAKPNAPILMSPRGEEEYAKKTNSVVFDGVYQKGATKVTIYVDNTPVSADLNNSDYTFKKTINLSDGTHKIYATQTIDGVESTKTADRFIIVNVRSENTETLQSLYNYDKLNLLNSYSRASYDVIDGGTETDVLSEIGEKHYGDSAFSVAIDSSKYDNIKYLSSDENVATVSSDGTVTIKDAGVTTISVSYTLKGSTAVLRDEKALNVKKKDITVSSIDTENKTVTFSGILSVDNGKVDVQYEKLVFTATQAGKIIANNFELAGESAYRYNVSSTDVQVNMNIAEVAISGMGTEASPYIIDNAYKFKSVFAKGVDTSKRTGGYHFLQTADLELGEFIPETEIAFNGTYKGGNISDGIINTENKVIDVIIGDENTIAPDNTSLFGKLESATVSYIRVTGTVFGGKNAGVIAGTIINSEISYCEIEADVSGTENVGSLSGVITGSTITDCYIYNNVTGNNYIGGISGVVSGTVINGGISESNISGTNYTGGLFGSLEASSVCKDSSFEGTVNGEDYIGGIAGEISASTLENATFTGETEGKYYVGGFAGIIKDKSTVKSGMSGGSYIRGKYYIGGISGVIETLSQVISTNNGSQISGTNYIGGIAGTNSGIITDCENNGIVTGTNYIGGIAGKSEGTVDLCTNVSDIEGNNYTGGIVGITTGTAKITACENDGAVTGNEYVGGIAGCMEGNTELKNCVNSNTIKGKNNAGGIAGLLTGSSLIESSENKADITAERYAGGIAGMTKSSSKILKSSNSGSVSSLAYAGGIAGRIGETSVAERCVNYGRVIGDMVAGGIAAIVDYIIGECGNEGNISSDSGNAGGIAGEIITAGSVNISESYNMGDIDAGSSAGGILAYVDAVEGVSLVVSDCYNSGALTGVIKGSAVGKLSNATDTRDESGNVTKLNTTSFSVSNFYDTKNPTDDIIGVAENKVVVKTESVYVLNGKMADKYNTPGSSPSNPIIISTPEQFKSYFGSNGSNNDKLDDNLYFKQTVSFNLGEYLPNSSTPFTGYYNGGGYTITYTITNPTCDNQGLFGYAKNAVFKNVVTDGTIIIGDTGTNAIYNVSNIGGIVGLIDECRFENCTNGVDIVADKGGNWFGGIAGNYSGTRPSYFKNCVNNGTFTKIRYGRNGGIAGRAYANFDGCLNNANISTNQSDAAGIVAILESPVNNVINTALEIKNCANRGTMTSESASADRFGAIVGTIATNKVDVNILQCFNTAEIKGESSNGAVSGVAGIVAIVQSVDAEITIDNCYNTGKISANLGNKGLFVGGNISESSIVIVKNGYDSSKSELNVIGTTMTSDSSSNIFILPNTMSENIWGTEAKKLKNLVSNGTLSSSIWTTKTDNSGYPQLIENPHTPVDKGLAEDDEAGSADYVIYAKEITEANLLGIVASGEFAGDVWGFDNEGDYKYPVILWDGVVNPGIVQKDSYLGSGEDTLLQNGYFSDNYVILSAQFMLNSYAGKYEYGYLISREKFNNFTYENENIKKFVVTTNKNGIFGLVLMFGDTVTANEDCYYRPYIRYFDADGHGKCAYGEIKSFVTK